MGYLSMKGTFRNVFATDTVKLDHIKVKKPV